MLLRSGLEWQGRRLYKIQVITNHSFVASGKRVYVSLRKDCTTKRERQSIGIPDAGLLTLIKKTRRISGKTNHDLLAYVLAVRDLDGCFFRALQVVFEFPAMSKRGPLSDFFFFLATSFGAPTPFVFFFTGIPEGATCSQ